MPPPLIVCLRHGEEPANAEDKSHPVDEDGWGLEPNGQVNRHCLTVRGWQRAGALAATEICGTIGRGDDVSVLVPNYDSDSLRHVRPYHTVLPFALRRGIKPRCVCPADRVDLLAARLQDMTGTAVVCWKHDCLEDLVQRLTGSAAPWPDDRFDVLWLLQPAAHGGQMELSTRHQALLPFDKEGSPEGSA